MTDEMEIWNKQFQDFLVEIDKKYAGYFASDEIEVNSINFCFGIWNGANLKAVPRNLRQDIYDEVVNKHKEIWGEWHRLDVL